MSGVVKVTGRAGRLSSSMNKPTVFISYSHKDEGWKDRLRPHLKALEQTGQLVVWDDRKIDAGETWYPEIEQAMARAAVALCLISADYLASDFCAKQEVPFLLERQERDGMLLIPVLLRKCPWRAHRWVSERQMLPRDGKSVQTDFRDDPDTVFADVAERIDQKLNDPDFCPPVPTPLWPELPAEAIDLTRLPETGSALFGRDEQLDLLDELWEGDRNRVVSFVAWGGVGKSTLINRWLAHLAAGNYRGASRVFGWSFYSQGARDQITSADVFINRALRFFGDPQPEAGSPWDKGERLARLVGRGRSLVVLDGMEPLQSAHAVDRGRLRDPALATFLQQMRQAPRGLCIITTREPVADLHDGRPRDAAHRSRPGSPGRPGADTGGRDHPAFVERNLEEITPQAGRSLLRSARVVGTDAQLEALAERFGPHALAVSLLGSYLYLQPGHTTEVADRMGGEGEPIDRILAGFERLLGEGPEFELLRMLGLFDRAATAAELSAVRRGKRLAGLTHHLPKFDRRHAARVGREGGHWGPWHAVVDRLRELRLLAPYSSHQPDVLDCHPLVREHFARSLRGERPEAWREGHRRLYEHLTTTTPYRPVTLDGLMPLFAAVTHGCAAGRQQETLDEVYRERIQRGEGFYSTRKLGALGAELAAVSTFFDQLWDQPSARFTKDTQAYLLNEAGLNLQALGRLAEAVQPLRAALKRDIEQEDWMSASIEAGNLSVLHVTLGELPSAVHAARQSVELADRIGDWRQRMISSSRLAYSMHQSGQVDEAEALFRESEAIQQRQAHYPYLDSFQDYCYWELLLGPLESESSRRRTADAGDALSTAGIGGWSSPAREECLSRIRVVRDRATQALEWSKQGHSSLLTIALERLTLGRTYLYELWIDDDPESRIDDRKSAIHHLERAVDGLRESGQQDDLPRGLFSRAWLRALLGDAPGSERDLGEALSIAERGGMRLHEADHWLMRARLEIAGLLPSSDPSATLARARTLITTLGYHRRTPELDALTAEWDRVGKDRG
jgi:tetratricopeptide (TPR) repeat protein